MKSLEWTAYCQKTDRLKFVRAETHKEAIKKAVNKYDIVPKDTHDVRPRTGDTELLETDEFEEYMEKELQ